MNLNRAQLIGNLTRDPETRTTPNGQTVSTFGVATSSTWKDAAGQKQERVEFHNIVAWGKLGEICGKYLKKGRPVYVEGRLQTRSWEDQQGNKRYTTEIRGDRIVLLGGGGGGARQQSRGAAAPSEDPMGEPVSELTDDDIPF